MHQKVGGSTVHLHYISRGILVIFAGGDPWRVNATLQGGRPAQISDLAQAFHDAGRATTEAEAAFRSARDRFRNAWTHENGENPIDGSAEVRRATMTLGLQAAQLSDIGIDLENVAVALAKAQRSGNRDIAALEGQLQHVDDQIGAAADLENRSRLSDHQRELLDEYVSGLEQQAINDTKEAFQRVEEVRNRYARQLQQSMTNLRVEYGYDPAVVRSVDAHLPDTPGRDRRDQQRLRNQTDAFKQFFGREPGSETDWATAAVLDAPTYDPKFSGAKSEIEVVKIRPVPGQGVVRVSQWIEQRDVWNFPPPTRDLGNNRVADQHFDPEDTKVTMYIDYENGIVVLRQNPSVEETATGAPGRVAVGIPKGNVTQLPNGSVRIRYDAANPLAPGFTADPQGLFANHTFTVNGDLVFTPGPDGVQVNGTRTDYPSLEAYQDTPNGGTRTLLIDPAQSGRSLGPAMNLPGHHDVGPLGGKAFAPFDIGGWNRQYDVPGPSPSTEFGPVTNPPSVAPLAHGAVPA